MSTLLREEDLIKAVQQYSILYDRNHPDFRDKRLKGECWKEIATQLNTTSETAQTRWRSLNEVFARHLREEMKMAPGAFGISKGAKWKWAPFMEPFRQYYSFMANRATEVVQDCPNIVSRSSNINGRYALDIGDESKEAIADFVKRKRHRAAETSTPSTSEPTATGHFQHVTPGQSNATPATPVEENLNETIYSPPPPPQGQGMALDAMDHFMLKCAKRMKTLPPYLQADLQMQISEAITHNENDNLRKINTWQNK